MPGGDAILTLMPSTPGSPDLIDDLDAYLDAAPRPDSDAVAVGPFTLFVPRTPWSYYARPTVGQRDPITGADLDALAAACADRGVDLSIEWVHEMHPELAEVAAAQGLDVSSHALMSATAEDVTAPQIDGVTLRIADAGDPALAAGRAVADVAFTAGGTGTGPEGAARTRQVPCRPRPRPGGPLARPGRARADDHRGSGVARGRCRRSRQLPAYGRARRGAGRRHLAVLAASRTGRCAHRDARTTRLRRWGADRPAVRPGRRDRQRLCAGRIPAGRDGTRRRARGVTGTAMRHPHSHHRRIAGTAAR